MDEESSGQDAASRAASLRKLFDPRSIAIVGASDSTDKVGGRVVASLIANAFQGRIFPVNPGRKTVQGLTAYPDLATIGEAPDLAIIALPASDIEAYAEIACKAGAGAIIVFASGFAELDEEGRAHQERIAAIVQRHGVSMIGPNCLGIMDGNRGMAATSTVSIRGYPLQGGRAGFISQSGAIATFWIDKMRDAGFGFGKWASIGNEADVDLATALAYYVQDPATEVICVYAEGFRDGARLRRALAEAAARQKPVIMMKAGRSTEGATAAASHTGALAGEDALYNALFERYGVCRVGSLTEMVDVARIFLTQRPSPGARAAIVTLSGGVGALMTDAAVESGFEVAPLSARTQAALQPFFPGYVKLRNPIDLTDRILVDTLMYGQTLEVLMASGEFDHIMTFMAGRSPNLMRDSLSASLQHFPTWQGGHVSVWQLTTPEQFASLRKGNIAIYDEFLPAVRALGRARAVVQAWDAFAPEALPAIWPGAASHALAEHAGKAWLTEQAGLAIPAGFLARSADESSQRIGALRMPVAAKLQSAQMMHKSGAGGIELDLRTPEAIAAAVSRMLALARQRGLPCDGVLVEQMEDIDFELLVGLRHDPVLGPFLVLGRGGVAVEVDPDIVRALLPLDAPRIEALLRRLRCYPLLSGHRGRRPAPIAELAALVERLCARFAADATLAEIEINPLAITRSGGIVALDAALRLRD